MIPVEQTMGAPPYARQVLRWLAASATAALATFLLVWLRANSTTAGMVFLVLVVWWATQAGIVLSIYSAFLSAVCFDYFFLTPIRTLRIEGAQQWVAMVSFALSCLVVSRLAERVRKQTVRAQQREEDVGKLYSLSQEMMLLKTRIACSAICPAPSAASSLSKGWFSMSETTTGICLRPAKFHPACGRTCRPLPRD